MIAFVRTTGSRALALAGAALLAGCAAKVVPPPPPPPPVVVIPPRPTPPMGAAMNMAIPAMGFDGVRDTVNARLTPAQVTWNLRSALNVAALNCLEPRYLPITDAYGTFLKTHARGLSATNRTLDSEFRTKFGSTFRSVRDAYMTQVYNYFALPPSMPQFCEAALAVSQESLLVAPADLDAFAARALPQLDAVFENFFRSYEDYRVQLAAWDARYGPPSPTMPATAYVNPLDPSVPSDATVTASGAVQSDAAVPPAGGLIVPQPAPPLVMPPVQAQPGATGTAGATQGPSLNRRR